MERRSACRRPATVPARRAPSRAASAARSRAPEAERSSAREAAVIPPSAGGRRTAPGAALSPGWTDERSRAPEGVLTPVPAAAGAVLIPAGAAVLGEGAAAAAAA